MNLMDYLASGGLERLLLIGAAILITYWGYHLYSRAQIAGLAMIAVSALLLMSVVLTSGRHQQAVNANLLASIPATEPPPLTATIEREVLPEAAAPQPSLDTEAVTAPDASEPSPFVDESPAAASLEVAPSTETPLAADANLAADTSASAEPDRIERLVPLASGQELGGRITSVRSENVTLEWSAGDSRRRVISSSATP